jgi:ABC-2 type transport system permease protein
MKYKKSFFNVTVLGKDITRFCPVWALYLVFGLLWAFSNLKHPTSYYTVLDLSSSLAGFSIVNLIYGFIVAMMLFGDLFKSQLCNGLHALAPRREGWFLTHCVAGLLFSLVPNAILTLLLFYYTYSELWFISLFWLLGMALEYLFFFGLAVFCMMCSGNRFASIAVYALINFGSMLVYWFIATFYEPLLYGVQISQTEFICLSPLIQLLNLDMPLSSITQEWLGIELIGSHSIFISSYRYPLEFYAWYPLVIAAVGLVLLVLALLLYRRRKLECAGNLMAFRWMRPVFAVVFTLSVGALFEMIGSNMIGTDYLFLAIGIVVGYFTGQMLLQRTVAVFKLTTFAGCAAVGLALVLSIGLTALDPLDIERWVPNPKNVQTITISHYNPSISKSKSYGSKTYDSPRLIAALTEVHQAILDDGEVSVSRITGVPSLKLTYKMKDGREVTRSYFYKNNGNAYQKIKQFYSLPENILGYSDWDAYLESVNSVAFRGALLSGEQAKELVTAIRADCENGSLLANISHISAIYTTLQITTEQSKMIILHISYDCENTIAWLEANVS